ncbi:MAG: DUF835 domain-containing protein [Thermoplasmata archaeon]|nr:DUF835 domain-containing protein [Thermoplasmata archaeon]
MEEYIYKPTHGKCSRCGGTRLVFYDEGNGKCAACGYEFIWKRCTHCGSNSVEHLDTGEIVCRICGARQIFLICPRCQSRDVTFASNGLGVCRTCGHEVYWMRVKKEEEKQEAKPAQTLEVIPALYIKDTAVHYALNIGNRTGKRIENVNIELVANKEKLKPETDAKQIKYIEPDEHARIMFELEPLKEFRNEPVRAKIRYSDGNEKVAIETEPKYLSIEFTALYPREVIEEHWRVATHTMRKIEKEIKNIRFSGETLHRIICDVIRERNMYQVPFQSVKDARFFRAVTKFFAHDHWDNLYAAYVETIEEGGEARLILRFYCPKEELLLPFYAAITSEITGKILRERKEEPAPLPPKDVKEEKEVAESPQLPAQQQIEVPLEKGYSYLIFESKTEKAFEIFGDMIKDSPGLCITTTYPDKVREKYGIGSATIYWLSDTETPAVPVVKPSRMEFEIMRAITSFIKSNKNAVILLDGFENLVLGNNFLDALKFMKKVNDVAAMHHATVLVPISPKAFDEKDMYTLRKEFDKTRTV